MGKGRMEAFSDGVFAVAITLLVLDLHLPASDGHSVAYLLAHQWPQYFAYVVSFMVIGIIWVNHHVIIDKLARVDRALLFLNLLLLLFVVLIPFPTSVVSSHLSAGGWDAKVAVAFYNVVMEGMGLAISAIYVWAGRHHELLDESVDRARHRWSLRQFGLGTVAYPVLAAVAFLSPLVAFAGDFVLAGFYVFDQTAANEGAVG
jgi:uncharacterized membrane protein